MHCPACSNAYLDAYGRCPSCGYAASGPPAAFYPVTYSAPVAPTGVSLAAQILIGIVGLVALLGVGAHIYEYIAAQTVLDGSDASSYDSSVGTGGMAAAVYMLSLLATLAAGVVFIIWNFKAAKLSALLAPGQQSMQAGWAIGGWFVPFAYFVLPRLVMGGIWRSARPLDENGYFQPRGRTHLVTWWWITFCLGQTFMSSSIVNIENSANDHDGSYLAGMFVGLLFFDLLRISSAVLAIVMLRKITTNQQIRILQGPGQGSPYAMPQAMAYGAVPTGYPVPPFPQAGHPQPGYAQPGYPQPGYPQPGYPQPFPPAQDAPQPYLPTQDAPALNAAPAVDLGKPVVELGKPYTSPEPQDRITDGPPAQH